MNFSKHDFVTINDILADALKLVGDVDMKFNSKGWYTSQIQQCLESLSYDTFFLDLDKDFDLPENLRLDMPKGAFNLQQIYLFNGDSCHIKNRVNVYHKKNFINDKSGGNYVARDNYSNYRDRFHKQRSSIKNTPDNVYFYDIQNGVIMLSPNCHGFEKIKIVYSGVHTSIGEVPVIPTFLRQAVKTKVVVEGLASRMAQSIGMPEYNQIFNLHNLHDNKLNHPYDGEWVKAERRVKSIDRKKKQDIKEYFQAMNY